MPRSVNFITGPSRSGDIEQTLELGAHGPRRLLILIVDERRRGRRREPGMSRQRRPSAAELALWHRVDGRDARRSRERQPLRPPAPPPAPPAPPAAARPREPVPRRAPTRRALDPQRPVDLDRRTWLRLKRGQVELERRSTCTA